jgi:hypothetical protein
MRGWVGVVARPSGAQSCMVKRLYAPAGDSSRSSKASRFAGRIQAPSLYKGLGSRVVVRSQRARWDGARGGQVKAQCGMTVPQRTVVVDLFFPKTLPSASLSQGTVFVCRTPLSEGRNGGTVPRISPAGVGDRLGDHAGPCRQSAWLRHISQGRRRSFLGVACETWMRTPWVDVYGVDGC